MPAPGELFERTYDLDGVEVGLLAEVEIDGSQVHLKDIAVFPSGVDQASPGLAAVRRVLRQELLPELAAEGFTSARISGVRVTGPTPGRRVDLVFDLSELR